MATQYWAEGVWTGKWHHEQEEAWMRQIQEVQMWRQVRGPAGAVMCETRYLGTKWPHWHTLTSSDEKRIDMRFVCSRDEKMLVHMARSVYWRQQSTSMKWFGPKKHCNVARKISLERGWAQKRLFDIGRSDFTVCQAC